MTTSSGTPICTQVRTAGGLPARFARRGAPAPGEPVPSPARTSPAGRTARTRLNVDDACARHCSPPRCSDRPHRPPTAWPRRSAAPCAGSVPAAAPAGWPKSSATTPRRPPGGCAGSASSPPRRLPRRPASPGPRPPGRSPGLAARQAMTQPGDAGTDEQDVGPVRACGIPRGPARQTVPVQTLHDAPPGFWKPMSRGFAGVLGHPARLLALRDPRRSAFRTPPGRRCGSGQTGVPGPVTAAGSDPVRRVAAAAIPGMTEIRAKAAMG
jgi:hypothetical protein